MKYVALASAVGISALGFLTYKKLKNKKVKLKHETYDKCKNIN